MTDDQLLYGRDDEERIVAVEPLKKEKSLVRVYKRDEDDNVTSDVRKSKMLLFLNEHNHFLANVYDPSTEVMPLMGKQHYNRLVTTSNFGLWLKLKRNRDEVVTPNLNCQYLIQSGKTLFKGMSFDEQLVLAFDIETITTEGYEFPNASREGDEITIISLYSNRGHEIVLHQNDFSEEELLNEFIKSVHEIDPDVLIGHNVFNFDLPYIEERCQRYDIRLALGRNGSEAYKFNTRMKLADRYREYTNYNFYGRHVIDTELLARQADVVKRKYENYRLKYLAQTIGVAPDDRTYIEGSDISDIWKGNHPKQTRDDLINYALDDVIETIGLYQHFGQATFYSTQFLPMPYQEVFRLGSGVKIEYIFMRYYLYNSHSWPEPEEKRDIIGGLADLYQYGFVNQEMVYADVKSLYPSLGTELEIQPKRDELKYYQKLLHCLKNKRYELKANIKKAKTDEEKDMHKSTDGSVKILLNSMAYGYLSWSNASFNDYDEAERITKGGRKVLTEMIELTRDMGGEPVKVDTDGMLTTIPPTFDDVDDYIAFLSDSFSENIIIENDGEYQKVIIFDKKSYAMLNTDGSVTMKGQTIRGRSIEPFGRQLIENCVKKIMDEKGNECIDIYTYYKLMLESRIITPDQFSTRGNIKETLDEYRHRIKLGAGNGGRNPDAPYELALKTDKSYEIGDVITYYVKEPPQIWMHYYGKKAYQRPKLKKYEKAEFIENYDKDFDMEYYLDRLETHMKRFLTVFDEEYYNEKLNIQLNSKDKKRLESYGVYT